MRITCKEEPQAITIRQYSPTNNCVEVQLCENISKDEENFICDCYVFTVQSKDNLEEEIKNNLQDWIQAARYSETGENASILRIAKEQALDEYTQKMLESEVSGDGNTDDEGKH